jgi:Gamma-glutamyltranspeptidase
MQARHLRYALIAAATTFWFTAAPAASMAPAAAENGMVVTAQHLATRVGVDVLKDGGNAVDAAVAVGYALAIKPEHRGAHEYIGEAYLMVGDVASAQKHLDALRSICLLPCEELQDLQKAIAQHQARSNPR